MPEHEESISMHLLGGGLAGLCADAVVHPLDTIRARLQTQQLARGAAADASHVVYKSATDAFVKMIKMEGVTSLYRGFSAVALGTVPGHALYFGGYELCKKYMLPKQHEEISKLREISAHLASGLIADVFGALVWTPQDVIKQRLQVQRRAAAASGTASSSAVPAYRGTIDACRTILKEEGVTGLYRGFGAGLLTYAPYVMLYFAMYEQMKQYLAKGPLESIAHRDINKLPFYAYLSCAALAGGVSAIVTCPLDVVKTRIQVQRKSQASAAGYRNAFDALVTITKEEGAAALFQGAKPRCLWMAGGTALTMLAYEELKKLMRVASKYD